MEAMLFSENIMKSLILLFILIGNCHSACDKALGMEDGRIKDKQITSLNWLYQSQPFNLYYKPFYGRLNNKKLGGGGWCSQNIEQMSGAYIEIDLLKNTKITAIATQGRGIGFEYIDEYGITYRRDKDSEYREYKERGRWHIFTGNNDTSTVVRNQFKHPIIARRIRIVPQGDLFAVYCGRFELYGCDWKKQKDGLVSYQLPLANDMEGIKTTDNVYDGSTSQLLSYKAAGLGKLTDDNYGTPLIGNGQSSAWIAYKKRIKFSPFFQFDFASKRRFNAIKFHMLNKGSNIKVFTRVQVLFSDDGRKFGNEVAYLTTAAERLSSAAFVITVPINQVVAKHIKCVFTQPKDWMLFSEVDFASDSPNAPLPTDPPPPPAEKEEVPETREPEKETTTEEPTVPSTPRPTPRLIFSLPISISSEEVINKIYPKSKPPSENDVKNSKQTDKKKNNLLPPQSKKQGKGSLSFPIIIAIVLGAIVISAIAAVFIFRQIRKMGKEKARQKSGDEKLVRSTKNNQEFNELLPVEKQGQPTVVVRSNATNELSMKLILDSGYTSHGSGGGSVKDAPISRASNGSPI